MSIFSEILALQQPNMQCSGLAGGRASELEGYLQLLAFAVWQRFDKASSTI